MACPKKHMPEWIVRAGIKDAAIPYAERALVLAEEMVRICMESGVDVYVLARRVLDEALWRRVSAGLTKK